MAFDIYRNRSLNELLHSLSALQDALARLGDGNSLVLDAGFIQTTTFQIDAYDTSVFLGNDAVQITLGDNAGRLHLYGTGNASVQTGTGETRVWGSEGDNILTGNIGRDILIGRGGNDILSGGDGHDKLQGGEGDDRLIATNGSNVLMGDGGSDVFQVAMTGGNRTQIRDFSVQQGDQIVLTGLGPLATLTEFLTLATVTQHNDFTVIRFGENVLQLRNFAIANFEIAGTNIGVAEPVKYDNFEAFNASGWYDHLSEVEINGTTYRVRDTEPLHAGYKYQDANGAWWSPDYFVLVAAGQSNMVGAGTGGDLSLNQNVVAYDWVNGQLVLADYNAAPAGGVGVRTGTSVRNNLYFPLANHLAETLGQPVLVIARPISGSSIVSWVLNALDPDEGQHFADLSGDIAEALAAIGQGQIDLFTWLQGEANFPMAHETYRQYFLDLLEQVRGAAWGAADTAILVGELSREGVNFMQNRVFQELEMSETDPNLGFVSSTGLATFDDIGIHYDGAALVDYGYHRFWAAYQNILLERENPGSTATGNTAPTPVDQTIPHAFTMTEGEELRINVSSYFTDAEGDTLYYFAYLDQRQVFMDTSLGEEIILRPGFEHAGTWTFHIYASDYYFDSENADITVTILDGTPHLTTYSSNTFLVETASYASLSMAMLGLSSNRGLRLLDQSALSADGLNLITVDTVHITAAKDLSGTLTLNDGILRGYLYGAADLDYSGNSENNRLLGNDGQNTLLGMAGADQLYGGGGDDVLDGGTQNDVLYGEDGDDILFAGSGTDHVWGGRGADIFHFALGDERTLLRDFNFETDGDHIVLAGLAGITDFASFLANAGFRDSDGRLLIDFPGDQLVIYGVTTAQLSADMFTFA